MKKLFLGFFFGTATFAAAKSDIEQLAQALATLSEPPRIEITLPSSTVMPLDDIIAMLMNANLIYGTESDHKEMAKRGIWQLKVPTQKGTECAGREKYNTLWLLKAFTGPQNKFLATYKLMTDENRFKNFYTNGLGLQLGEQCGVQASMPLPDIMHRCQGCLPAKSSELASLVINVDTKTAARNDFATRDQELASSILPTQGNLSEDERWDIYTANYLQLADMPALKTFINSPNGTLGVKLGTNAGGPFIAHGTSVIAHKENGKLTLFFADSLNFSYLTFANYQRSLSIIKRLLSDDYFAKIVIRSFSDTIPSRSPFRIVRRMSDDKWTEKMKSLNLFKHPLFTRQYRSSVCTALKKAQQFLTKPDETIFKAIVAEKPNTNKAQVLAPVPKARKYNEDLQKTVAC